MDKQTIVNDLKQHANGHAFVSQDEIRTYVGRSHAYVKKLLADLDYTVSEESGKARKYHVQDVAQKIMDRRQIAG